MKIINIIFIFFFVVGCESTVIKSDLVQVKNNTSTNLVADEKEVGRKKKVLQIPIEVDTPRNATLDINFKIKSAGHCLTTYEPTVLSLNGQLVAEFDFRRYFLKKVISKKVVLKKELFNKGLNKLELQTGNCDYDIDVLKLNSIRLNYN